VNRKPRAKSPKASPAKPVEPVAIQTQVVSHSVVVPLKEVTVTCDLKFTLTLAGDESPEDVNALILGRFDQCVADKRALVLNRTESTRRVQKMLERAPVGRSSVNLWHWPIIVLS